MATEKVFSITGKEIVKEKACCKNIEGNAEASDVSNINYKSGFHVFTILFGCGLSMSILTLIPRHDSIQEPEYWYEIIFPSGFWIIFAMTAMILDWFILMERDSLVPIWSYLKVISTTLLGWLMLFSTCNMLWMKILDYSPPMPYIGNLCGIPTIIVGIVAVSMFLPYDFVEIQEYKRKSNKIVKYNFLLIVLGSLKAILVTLFNALRYTDAQCVIAFLIPIAKRCTNLVLSKAMRQMVGTNTEKANVSLMVTINFQYGFFVATSLSGARSITIVCMVVVEFLIQISMSFEIVKLHKKVTNLENDQARMDKQKAVLKLLLSELCEGLIPFAYAIGFSMAYYGPNGHLIGNVRNGYWQYQTVCNATWTLLVMFGLFSFDVICLLLNSGILWVFSSVNLFDEFCLKMQNYWHIIGIKMIHDIYMHFLWKDVNLANGWEPSNKNSSIFPNTTDICANKY